jgi:hypothetical protein
VVEVELPREAFTGGFLPVRPDPRTLSTLVGPLRELRAALAEYARRRWPGLRHGAPLMRIQRAVPDPAQHVEGRAVLGLLL